MVWKGTIEELQEFLTKMNSIHPTIKFTAEFTSPYKCDIEGPHDCFCHQTSSISFLDTKISIKNGKFETACSKNQLTDANTFCPQAATHPTLQKISPSTYAIDYSEYFQIGRL